jgi:hypothetical protein
LWTKLEKGLKELGKVIDENSRKQVFYIYLQKYIKSFNISKTDVLDIITDVGKILTQIKFFKQVDNIVDKGERNFVLKYYDRRFDNKKLKNKKQIKMFIDMIFNPYIPSTDDTFSGMEYKDIKIACESLTIRNMEFMDCYTISRILRSYKDSKRAEKIIVYAGNEHITNYLDFFSKMEGENIINISTSDTKDIDFQCINISRFKIPFFS